MNFETALNEATTNMDVTGTDTPQLIDWYGKRKKKPWDKLVRRAFGKPEKIN